MMSVSGALLQRVLRLAICLSVIGYGGQSWAQESADIQAIDSFFRATGADKAKDFPSPATVDRAHAILDARFRLLLTDNGIDGLAERLIADMAKKVKRALKSIGGSGLGAAIPYAARMQATQFITSNTTAQKVIANWMELPHELTPDNAGVLLDFTDSTKPRLAEVSRLSPQVKVANSNGPLAVNPQVKLLADSGGPGAGNQVIDEGEWVQLGFSITNKGPRHLFSTSAWIKATGGCLWVDENREYELDEMLPVNGHSFMALWVYTASDCSHDQLRALEFSFRDSHEFPKSPKQATATLSVRSAGQARLEDIVIDVDTSGSSKRGPQNPFGPGRAFEMSARFVTSIADAAGAQQLYGVSRGGDSLFSSLSYRSLPMQRTGNGAFSPSDDLDATVRNGKAYEQAMEALAEQSRWYSTTDGGTLWVAVDTVVLMPFAAPLAPDEIRADKIASSGTALLAPRAPSSAANENETRKARRQRLRRGEAEQAEYLTQQHNEGPHSDSCGKPADGAEVADLAGKHIRIAARPAEALLDDSLDAANGYEVVFDRGVFLQEYESLLGACPSQPQPASSPSPASYRYRNYLRIALPPIPRKRKPRVAHIAEELPVAEEAPKLAFPIRIDGGFGANNYSPISPNGQWENWDASLAVPAFALRLSYGKKFIGIAGISYGSLADSNVIRNSSRIPEVIEFSELSVEAGIGYLMPLSRYLEFQPRAVLSTRIRTIDSSSNLLASSGQSVGIGLGATLRGFSPDAAGFWRNVGGFADLGAGFHGASPSHDSGGEAVVGGNVFTLILGASIRL